MPKKDSDYKIKLLVLYEILKQNTDENKRLTTKELISMLAAKGISCDRKILYNDIKTLNDNGFEILTERGQQMEYYVANPAFEDYELRILIDTVQAAKFLTQVKTDELTNKLLGLAGSNKKDFVKENITIKNEIKSSNKNIFNHIAAITEAIKNNKKVQFRYFDLDIGGNKIPRNNNEFYVENPIDLVIRDDKYYLVTYSEKYGEPTTYRVDRMDNVCATKINAIKFKVKEAQELSNKSFSMYRGEDKVVTIKFNKKISGQIVDRLGCNFFCMEETDETCTIRGTINVSPTFYAWCFTFGDELTILEPKDIVEEYRKRLARAYNNLPKE
ncbi:MAG: WYL domain-containing transcriptional regulator [Clostridiales bacterium]|nr:WYL domain-containing transcriptional regulator [Clostridiales bacterium]